MTKYRLASNTSAWLNPGMERLLSKFMDLEETLAGIDVQNLPPDQQRFVDTCKTYLEEAKNLLERPLKYSIFGSRHPHLVWELLHRVDEYLLLLIRKEELKTAALEIRNSCDLNIKEEKTRARWIGDKGKLNEAVGHIDKGNDDIEDRYVLKGALKLVNEQMDRTFWQLSANTLTSVWSGALLGLVIVLAWAFHPQNALFSLDKGGLTQHFWTLFGLGLMGAYLSNLMTKDDFLYLRGGPYWRYFFHNLFSKPVMSAFAAIFVYLLARTELIFSIGSSSSGSKIFYINVKENFVGYAYAILAIVSGFAADKILKNMIDSVLKKLEQKAEKIKDSSKN